MFSMAPKSPFHPGEQQVQTLVGVRGVAESLGQGMIRGYMPEQHRQFYANQQLLYIGSVDNEGRVWASVLSGPTGFVSSPDATHLSIDASMIHPSDPMNLQPGSKLGCLGLELTTRRRNRVNGTLLPGKSPPSAPSTQKLLLQVNQSFGNCPKYIQTRVVQLDFATESAPAGSALRAAAASRMSGGLGPKQLRLVAAADTFFLATSSLSATMAPAAATATPQLEEGRPGAAAAAAPWTTSAAGCDISHRGGAPGFVAASDDGTQLQWPDFAGNNMFNSLGNIMLQPHCGLLFIDWTSGDTLQITGTATTDFNNTSMPGAQRVVVFAVAEWVWTPKALPLAAPAPVLEHSPYNPRLLKKDPVQFQELQCVSVVDAAVGIKTFEVTAPEQWKDVAAAEAGQALYQPGQFASFDFELLQQGGEASSSTTYNRTWTISSHPSETAAKGTFTLSIKKDGLVSSHMHTAMRPGMTLRFRGVGGTFTPAPYTTAPALLVAGGIGITPLRVIALELLSRGVSVVLLYSVRHPGEAAFLQEFTDLAAAYSSSSSSRAQEGHRAGAGTAGPSFSVFVAVTGADPAGRHLPPGMLQGRIDRHVIAAAVPHVTACEMYLCGPAAFMSAMERELVAAGAQPQRIYTESFSF